MMVPLEDEGPNRRGGWTGSAWLKWELLSGVRVTRTELRQLESKARNAK